MVRAIADADPEFDVDEHIRAGIEGCGWLTEAQRTAILDLMRSPTPA